MARRKKDHREPGVREPRKLSDGREAFDVFYRDVSGRQRQVTKYSLEEANQLALDIRYGRPSNDLLPDTTLGEFFARDEVRAELKRAHKLSDVTVGRWLSLWRLHICHADYGLAGTPLKDLSKKAPHSAFLVGMDAAGVGEPTQRRALGIVSAILDEAVEEDLAESNPIPGMKGKPASGRKPQPYIPSIKMIELLRREVMEHPNTRRRNRYAKRDGMMISLLAYEAPRPEEFRGMDWDHVLWGDEQLFIFAEKAMRGKAHIVERWPPLNEVVAEDLRDWFEELGEPGGHTPVLPLPEWGARRGGDHWTKQNWKDWRNRIFKPALKRVADQVARNKKEHDEICAIRPYDLRHTAISTWIANGGKDENGEWDGSPGNPTEVADWAGHDLRTMWEIYAHRTKNRSKIPIATQIRDARAEVWADQALAAA